MHRRDLLNNGAPALTVAATKPPLEAMKDNKVLGWDPAARKSKVL